MSPVEIKELWDGMLWRRSRDIEVLAQATRFIMRPHYTSEIDFDDVVGAFPGYDDEWERAAKEAYLAKVRKTE